MFGYIQPLKCELKIREYDYYRAAYCGLCNSLRIRCGIKARFIVNYDFVFISLLLAYGSDDEKTDKRRCIACPGGRNCIISPSLDRAADISVILTYLKLCDDVKDKSFLKGILFARIPRFFLKRAYKKAKAQMPEFEAEAKRLYDELALLEKTGCDSIDETADKFALMLCAIVEDRGARERILREMLYHIGRFVYIIDALDDFYDDVEKSEYNPIAERFKIKEKEIPEAVKLEVLTTLEDSRQAVLRAFELLPKGKSEDIIRNIIDLGMNAAVSRVIKKENEK